MESKGRTSGCRLAQTVCIALALAGNLAALAAEPPAIIVSRALTVAGGKEVDAAVNVLAIDSRPVTGKPARIEISPGQHTLEVLCAARVFVGMGTVDFPSKSVLTIRLESARVYRLDADVTVQGGCRPMLE